MIVKQGIFLCSATNSVLYVSFISFGKLSEFIITYDYMFGLHVVCLMSGNSFYCSIIIFDICPLSIDYIGLTTFFVVA